MKLGPGYSIVIKDENYKVEVPLQHSGAIENIICDFTTIIIFLCFIPQMLTILGIPMVFDCIRRFRLGMKGEHKENPQFALSFLGQRGVFLFTMNIFSLIYVMFLTLAFNTILHFVLVLINKTEKLVTKTPVTNLDGFRTALHFQYSAIVGCFIFPLSEPMPVRTHLSEIVIDPWRIGAGFIYFLALLLVVPIVDIVTDFIFSTQLLLIYNDPYLENRDQLFVWMVISFAASAIGVLVDLIRFVVIGNQVRKCKEREDYFQLLVELSPLGLAVKTEIAEDIIKNELIDLSNAVFEDLPKVLVASFTLDFVGELSFLWSLKLAFAIISLSAVFARLFPKFVYGKRITVLSRGLLVGLYFFLFGFIVCMICGFHIRNEFCQLNRSVDIDLNLPDIQSCTYLTGSLQWKEMKKPIQAKLQTQNLTASFIVLNNSQELNLTFSKATQIDSPIQVVNNTGALYFSFPTLEVISGNASILIQGNTNFQLLSLPALHEIDPGSSFEVIDTFGFSQFSNSIVDLGGNFLVQNSSMTVVSMASLLSVSGSITITDNQMLTQLPLPILTQITGSLIIESNPSIQTLSFGNLLSGSGSIVIKNNPALTQISFPAFFSGILNLEITGNQNLQSLSFPNLQIFSGTILISNNQNLVEISMPRVEQIGTLEISSNPSLLSLSFSKLTCLVGNPFLFISSNQHLKSVNAGACLFVQISNNPSLDWKQVTVTQLSL